VAQSILALASLGQARKKDAAKLARCSWCGAGWVGILLA